MNEFEHRDPTLTAALRAVAEEDAAVGASPAVEERLLQEVRAIARARRRRNQTMALAVAAAVILAVAISVWQAMMPKPSDSIGLVTVSPPTGAQPPVDEVATAFFPLIHGSVPLTGGHIVRMPVPRRALVSFGLAQGDDAGASGTVLADVIVGEDGLARAVRFVDSGLHQE